MFRQRDGVRSHAPSGVFGIGGRRGALVARRRVPAQPVMWQRPQDQAVVAPRIVSRASSSPRLRARGHSHGSGPASASWTRGSKFRQSALDRRTSLPEESGIRATPACPAAGAVGSDPNIREARFGTGRGVRMTKRTLLAMRYRRRNCCSALQPILRSRAASLNAPDCPPMSASQVEPTVATWRNP